MVRHSGVESKAKLSPSSVKDIEAALKIVDPNFIPIEQHAASTATATATVTATPKPTSVGKSRTFIFANIAHMIVLYIQSQRMHMHSHIPNSSIVALHIQVIDTKFIMSTCIFKWPGSVEVPVKIERKPQQSLVEEKVKATTTTTTASSKKKEKQVEVSAPDTSKINDSKDAGAGVGAVTAASQTSNEKERASEIARELAQVRMSFTLAH